MECTKEKLLQFKKDIAAREEAERQAKAMGDGFGGFGGFGGGGGEEAAKDRVVEKEDVDGDNVSIVNVDDVQCYIHNQVEAASDDETHSVIESAPLSKMEQLMEEEKKIRLLYQQDTVISEISTMLQEFDDTLFHLVHEKTLTDLLMKTADLK